MKFQFKKVHGKEIQPYLEILGQLRINVFKEFPYLYKGSLSY